eukprot:1477059-Rhodomonas_salina.3
MDATALRRAVPDEVCSYMTAMQCPMLRRRMTANSRAFARAVPPCQLSANASAMQCLDLGVRHPVPDPDVACVGRSLER